MEKLKPLAMLLVAVVLAGIATWSGTSYLRQKEDSIRAEIEAEKRPVKVLVASRDLVAGDRLSVETLQIRKIPAEYVADGTLTPADFDYVDGLMINEPISFGKPVMRHFIRGVSGVGSFSELLEIGQRALTLEVDSLTSAEGLIQTGDYIDLAVVTKSSKDKPAAFVHLMDKVLVLATGNISIADGGLSDTSTGLDYRSITLGLNMKDIPRVTLANEAGELRFLLRNPEDKSRSRYPDQVASSGTGMVESFVGGKASNGVLKTNGEVIRQLPAKKFQQQMADNNRRYQKFQPANSAPAEGVLSQRVTSAVEVNRDLQPIKNNIGNGSPVETAQSNDAVQESNPL